MIASTFWRTDGTLDKILARLHLRLNEEGRLDYVLWSIDAARGKKPALRSR